GARKWCACEVLKISVRTYHRWQDDGVLTRRYIWHLNQPSNEYYGQKS
ncbi:MAG: hypothetical protein ACI9MF_001932, partial [Gammaproteobacteria bacterium]